MDVSHLIDDLNDAQRQAVTLDGGHCLVLAGAGSGKTRVLVHRIAWLIQVEHVSPMAVLALTFTNKAASEMRGRVEQLLDMPSAGLWIGTFHGMDMPSAGLWIGTFHGICHRILRLHADEAGLSPTFQILDSEDQYRLIRRTIREMQLESAGPFARCSSTRVSFRREACRVSSTRARTTVSGRITSSRAVTR